MTKTVRVRGQELWSFEDTKCTCGAEFDPTSAEWRCAGDHWQHYHGYPAGHNGRQVGYVKARRAEVEN